MNVDLTPAELEIIAGLAAVFDEGPGNAPATDVERELFDIVEKINAATILDPAAVNGVRDGFLTVIREQWGAPVKPARKRTPRKAAER